ncbi:MAG: formate dehydrogenase subunit gamma [Burkholderiaceae bacterium]|nr:formate dehydrogenase subunit gamma [Pseudomonadota bacterium]MBS0596713.1 formate dehydrogenase subunit gamma [Pseudomonadota bacterium]MCO5115052.1 formate dehydrogenase subunit gamma [Burkholderiaceae bacterium]MCP5219029.1 formate dehydrogenase subunit gamma [Burkholderiaceae bacterium]
MKKLQLQRYSAGQRSNHWAVATCFVLAAVSGFALFHPALFWLTALVGGPQWARILHPYLGIAMFVLFLGLFFAFAGANVWRKEDSQWLGSAGKLVSEGNAAQMPAVGKYNGGQKLVFWLFALCLIVLLVTGALFWQAWFAPSVPIWLQRIAVVLHALAAFGLVLTVIVHAYAAIWVKGTVQAMTRGTVSAGWARHHHPLWYREQVQGRTAKAPSK